MTEADQLRPGSRYIGHLLDCCVEGELDLGEFIYQSGEGWLYFDNASFFEWDGITFEEAGS